jgi:hypothetical protein
MKKLSIFAAFFLICGAVVFSHEKGDLALNFEIPVGGGFADIKPEAMSIFSGYSSYVQEGSTNFDFGIRATVNYYFFNWLSVNTGVAFGGIASSYLVQLSDDFYIPGVSSADYPVFDIMGMAPYVGIPVGFKLNIRAFVIGGGVAYYIPFSASSEISIEYVYYESGKRKTRKESITDDSFEYDPFLVGYVDIGFDLGGRSGRTRGFGMLLRSSFNFAGTIGSSDKVPYETFKHNNTFQIVFNYSFAVASFPIGGK